MIWSPTNDLITASTEIGTSIRHVKTERRIFQREGLPCAWFKNPREEASIMGLARDHVCISSWHRFRFSIKRTFVLPTPGIGTSIESPVDSERKDTPSLSVSKVLMTLDATHALYELSCPGFKRDQPKQQFFILPLAEIFEIKTQRGRKIDPEPLKAALAPL